MGLLIDGYNLLNVSHVSARRGRTALEGAREALLDWLVGVLDESERQATVVVFDARDVPPGLPRQQRRQGMTVRFAPRGREADELLEQLIAADSAPRSLTVVSSDHRVQRAVRKRRGRAVDSEIWIGEMAGRARPRPRSEPSGKPQQPLEPEDVQAWVDLFDESNPPPADGD